MSAALNKGRALVAARRQALQAFWAERTAQERKLLTIGGVVAGLALVYAVFFEPAWNGRIELQKACRNCASRRPSCRRWRAKRANCRARRRCRWRR